MNIRRWWKETRFTAVTIDGHLFDAADTLKALLIPELMEHYRKARRDVAIWDRCRRIVAIVRWHPTHPAIHRVRARKDGNHRPKPAA